MYKIGEFSNMSKTTIKTLRYYEKEGLLVPSYKDELTGYRFYETDQLIKLAKIIHLRQLGFSINNIKEVLKGKDFNLLLEEKKKELEEDLNIKHNRLLQINNLLEGKNMKYEVIIKDLPECTIYYKEGIIESFDKITEFILSSAEECLKTNPNIKCLEPEYCYVEYLDKEYKDTNIKIRYAQAVTEEGKPNETIKFEKLSPIKAACIYHKGSYSNLRDAYSFILEWIDKNGYQIAAPIRERYIDGMWNKKNENDWLTEIEVPIKENK